LAQIAGELCELCLVINLNEKKFRLMVTHPLFERNGYGAAPMSFGLSMGSNPAEKSSIGWKPNAKWMIGKKRGKSGDYSLRMMHQG
jgi:hypothetical protein